MLVVACTGCSSDTSEADGTAQSQNEMQSSDQGSVSISASLKGTLYFNYAQPLEAPRAMALNLKAKNYRVAADGINPSVRGQIIAYVNFCSPLAIQLAVADEDGFMSPLSECVEQEVFSDSLQGPAISSDGKRVAVLNHKLQGQPDNSDDDPYGLQAMIGTYEYSATQVFDRDGNIVAEFKDLGPATWTTGGELILAGRGGDAGYGIYQAGRDLKSVKRLDDGRMKSTIDAIDAHPKDDRVAFIFNGQLFDMSLKQGKPKRLHAHGHTLGGVAYAPNGKQIAFVSVDTLEEGHQMAGSGYPIFVYDNGDVHSIRLPFVISGPLDWTD